MTLLCPSFHLKRYFFSTDTEKYVDYVIDWMKTESQRIQSSRGAPLSFSSPNNSESAVPTGPRRNILNIVNQVLQPSKPSRRAVQSDSHFPIDSLSDRPHFPSSGDAGATRELSDSMRVSIQRNDASPSDPSDMNAPPRKIVVQKRAPQPQHDSIEQEHANQSYSREQRENQPDRRDTRRDGRDGRDGRKRGNRNEDSGLFPNQSNPQSSDEGFLPPPQFYGFPPNQGNNGMGMMGVDMNGMPMGLPMNMSMNMPMGMNNGMVTAHPSLQPYNPTQSNQSFNEDSSNWNGYNNKRGQKSQRTDSRSAPSKDDDDENDGDVHDRESYSQNDHSRQRPQKRTREFASSMDQSTMMNQAMMMPGMMMPGMQMPMEKPEKSNALFISHVQESALPELEAHYRSKYGDAFTKILPKRKKEGEESESGTVDCLAIFKDSDSAVEALKKAELPSAGFEGTKVVLSRPHISQKQQNQMMQQQQMQMQMQMMMQAQMIQMQMAMGQNQARRGGRGGRGGNRSTHGARGGTIPNQGGSDTHGEIGSQVKNDSGSTQDEQGSTHEAQSFTNVTEVGNDTINSTSMSDKKQELIDKLNSQITTLRGDLKNETGTLTVPQRQELMMKIGSLTKQVKDLQK